MSQISIRKAIRCKNIVSGYIMWFNICPCHKWLFMMRLLLINSADEPHWLAKAGSGIFLSIAQQYSRVYAKRLFAPWTFISLICSTKCILLHLKMIGEGWEAIHAHFMTSKRYRKEVVVQRQGMVPEGCSQHIPYGFVCLCFQYISETKWVSATKFSTTFRSSVEAKCNPGAFKKAAKPLKLGL